MLVEGFPQGRPYRNGAGVRARVESGEIFFRGGPGIGGVEECRRNREF